MRILSTLLFTLLFLPSLVFAALQIKVIGVHDGDTLTAIGTEDGVRYKVRLMGVDTPEVDFFGHTQGDVSLAARDFLASLAPVGSVLTVADGGSQQDKHGRILGRLVKDGVDINQEMLRNGWGVMYFIYPFDKRYLSDYSKAAKEGFENRRGMFSNEYSGTEIPYVFRLTSRNQVGRNVVGDILTKKLYGPDNYQNIPIYRRVFFPTSEDAVTVGYK